VVGERRIGERAVVEALGGLLTVEGLDLAGHLSQPRGRFHPAIWRTAINEGRRYVCSLERGHAGAHSALSPADDPDADDEVVDTWIG
jgi:hypothetical protein